MTAQRFELVLTPPAARAIQSRLPVLHRINEQAHEVIVLRIEHRRDVYGRH